MNNTQIFELYSSKWDGLSAAMQPIILNDSCKTKPANPLLLYVGKCGDEHELENADIRVMIFGKETYGWYGIFTNQPSKEKAIEDIQCEYDKFFNNRDEYYARNGFFTRGFKKFDTMLQAKYPNKKISYTWNNIIKIGKATSAGCPPDYIYNIEKEYFLVIKDEVRILKPHIILFLTGYQYDDKIENNFGKTDYSQIASFEKKELAKLFIPNVDFAYRTYHPRFLNTVNAENYFNAIIQDINF